MTMVAMETNWSCSFEAWNSPRLVEGSALVIGTFAVQFGDDDGIDVLGLLLQEIFTSVEFGWSAPAISNLTRR